LGVLAKAMSRPVPMLQKGFDTQPLGVDEVSTEIVQIGAEAQRSGEFTLAVLASTTGWDESARELIRGAGPATAFSHRWMLVYLSDLEERDLVYNESDERTREYLQLFSPKLVGEETEEVAQAIEEEIGPYSSLTLEFALKKLPYAAKSIQRAFEKLAASGRYVLTEVEGIGPAIVRS